VGLRGGAQPDVGKLGVARGVTQVGAFGFEQY
jgi:hypothetical protein